MDGWMERLTTCLLGVPEPKQDLSFVDIDDYVGEKRGSTAKRQQWRCFRREEKALALKEKKRLDQVFAGRSAVVAMMALLKRADDV